MNNVFVAGGSRGIGAAAVKLFRERGHAVAFSYKSSVDAAISLETQTGAHAVMADVTSFHEIEAALAFCKKALGFVDGLVINAGISQFKQICDVSDDDLYSLVNVNLLGAVNCVKAFSREMISKRRGCIVLLSSIQGITGASCESIYSMTKAGIIALTRSLAKELAPSGIRVNCVAPGLIDTAMNSRLTQKDISELEQDIPLNRMGLAREVASAIYFLMSDDASYITGETLRVDGGWFIGA